MADNNPADSSETLEQMQARHRKEAKDLQGRMTSKKKNATKKTRKGVNDECAEMERQMRERQAEEVRGLLGGGEGDKDAEEEVADDEEETQPQSPSTNDDDVAAKLNGLELGAKPPQRPAQQTTQEEEGGGPAAAAGTNNKQKRNRQKERLARRAAEQEAAAEAAEHEAANMTDHRGAERARMQAEFARRGLVEREIRPDGHCLFSAVADQLGAIGVPLDGEKEKEDDKKEEGYKIVRRRAAGYIEAHGDEYAGFLEEGLASYVRKMRDTAEWGGQLELAALASVYGVEIGVVQDREAEVIRPSGGDGSSSSAAAKGSSSLPPQQQQQERKKIWLAYYRHGYGLGEHYNSLRKKEA